LAAVFNASFLFASIVLVVFAIIFTWSSFLDVTHSMLTMHEIVWVSCVEFINLQRMSLYMSTDEWSVLGMSLILTAYEFSLYMYTNKKK